MRNLISRITARWMPIVLIVALVLAITLPGIGESEFFVNGDEGRHAMTALFFSDASSDRPLSDPVHYAKQYYGHYPALGLIHWPPLFHATGGVFFRLFGVSAVTARLCVAAFAVLLAIYFYRLARDLSPPLAAFVATVLLVCSAAVVSYSRIIMLEVPSLALCVASVFYFNRYLERGQRRRDAWGTFFFFTAAALTRQHALLLGPVILAVPLLRRQGRVLVRRAFLVPGLLSAALVGPYYIYTLYVHGGSVANDALSGARGADFLYSASSLTYYIRHLPKQVTVWVPVAAGLAALLALIRRDRRAVLPIAWALLCFLLFTAIAQKDSRYIIYWLPPICLLVASGLHQVWRVRPLRAVSALVGLLLLATTVPSAFQSERPYLRGYAEAAAFVSQASEGDPAFKTGSPIFFQGQLNATFIFHIRAGDIKADRRTVVLRGSKVLFVTNILAAYGSKQLIHEEQEILDAFDRCGVRFAVIESKNVLGAPDYDLLIKTLESDRFREVKTIPIETNQARFQGQTIRIFEYKQATYPEELTLVLPMETLSTPIRVKVR